MISPDVPEPWEETARAFATAVADGRLDLRTGEDRALVAALGARGRRVLRASSLPVLTSARRRYRAPAGFGHHLTTLGGTGSLLGAP